MTEKICPCGQELHILEDETYFCPFCGYRAPLHTSGNEDRHISIMGDMVDEEAPPVEFWCQSLVLKQGLTIIGGRPGCFKSMFVFSLALDMARGADYLDNFVTFGKPKILLYDLENGTNVLHMRQSYLLRDKGVKKSDLANFHVVEDFDKRNMKKELELAKNYDIVILDSYRRFLKGAENESEITDEFYNGFLKPLKEMEKSIIILHHFRKPAMEEEISDEELQFLFRGSSDIVSQVDLALAIFKGNETWTDKISKFEISVFKAKNRLGIPLKNFHFSVEKDDLARGTSMRFLGEKRFETPELARINHIVEFLREGEKSVKQIMEKLSDLSYPTINRALQAGLARGMIKSDKKGFYRLPEDVQEVLG